MMILKTKPPSCDSRSEISRSLREMADRLNLEGAAIAAESDEEDDWVDVFIMRPLVYTLLAPQDAPPCFPGDLANVGSPDYFGTVEHFRKNTNFLIFQNFKKK